MAHEYGSTSSLRRRMIEDMNAQALWPDAEGMSAAASGSQHSECDRTRQHRKMFAGSSC
jgi:hypothetical protein